MDLYRRSDIGKERVSVQEQHQVGSLPQLIGDGALSNDAPGSLHKIGWKVGMMEGWGTWHGAHPFALMGLVP